MMNRCGRLGKVLLVRIVKNVLLCILHIETVENQWENRGGSSS